MNWGILAFLAEPWFVIPWYAIGVLGAAAVVYDLKRHNTVVKQAIGWGWPIIVLFFSVIGLALYWFTARAPKIEQIKGQEAKQAAHDRYQENMFRRVNGAVIHCVAGDGLGIMTAMVIARVSGMTFWQEFWFEYLVGFLFGWLIFQLKSMMKMTDSLGRALAMAFRAEFFSMLTVMAGMGAVMTYVTPAVVAAQPKPLTYAFWGFGMLGLLVGYICTFPMNWMMVRLGWKHGMGSPEGARPVQAPARRFALLASMVVLGIAALALPAWLTEKRNNASVLEANASGDNAPDLAGSPAAALQAGLATTLKAAATNLAAADRHRATTAIDAALRLAEVGRKSAPGSPLGEAEQAIRRARHSLQVGDPEGSREQLMAEALALEKQEPPRLTIPHQLDSYEGAGVVDARGLEIGEITGVTPDTLVVARGGSRDVWGVIDLGHAEEVKVSPNALVFGPAGTLGPRLVALPGATPEQAASR